MPVNEKSFDRLQRLLADSISELRRTRGLSIADLADAVGISEPAMNAIETGFDPPTIITFARICLALGIDASVLLAAAEQKFRLDAQQMQHNGQAGNHGAGEPDQNQQQG